MRLFSALTLCLSASLAGLSFAQETAPPPPEGPTGQLDDKRSIRRGEFYRRLSPEQRERYLKLLEEWSTLAPGQRDQILDRFMQSRNLGPEQRENLRQGLDRFGEMPPARREETLERMRNWQQMSPEEQQKQRDRLREHRQAAEQEIQELLKENGLSPTEEQLRWIHHFHGQKRREIGQKVAARARELKTRLSPDSSEEERLNLRKELQQYRRELEQQAKQEVAGFAKDPKPVPSPWAERPPLGRNPRHHGGDHGFDHGDDHGPDDHGRSPRASPPTEVAP